MSENYSETFCPIAARVKSLETTIDALTKELGHSHAANVSLRQRLAETSAERTNALLDARALRASVQALLHEEVTSVCQRIRSILSTSTP